MSPSADAPFPAGRWIFVATLLALLAARLAVGMVTLPTEAIQAVSLVVSVLFVAAPILAMFAAAADLGRIEGRGRFVVPVALIVGGVLAQWLGMAAAAGLARTNPPLGAFLGAAGQTGLLVWCYGLGALLAQALRDRNMVLPIAVFLALFDLWLVFSPMGVVNKVMAAGGDRLKGLAYQVPAPVDQAARKVSGGLAQVLVYVGPADFLFLAMFFTVLFRFRMRTRETLRLMIPVLIAYLLVALVFGGVTIGPISLGALPALVPIGAVVLWVNRGEFQLAKDEKQATWFILIAGGLFVLWSIFIYKAPVEVVLPRILTPV